MVDGNRWFNVYTGEFLKNTTDIGNLVIGVQGNRPVYLRDVSLLHGGMEWRVGTLRRITQATRTNLACPNSRIRLSDLTAMTTSVARRASWREFSASPMTHL